MDQSSFMLVRPDGLDDTAWGAINSYADRLRGALRGQDRELAVGSCKDLVESVARVVLTTRGDPAASKTDYLDVLKPAHTVLEYQPGPGLTPDAPARAIASAAMKMAVRLRELRNDYGTGHGRAAAPVVQDEVLDLAVDGALVWVRWALRRLEHLLAGQLVPLLNDLRGAAYSRAQWAARLIAADVPHLDVADQRRLGVAVGQRAAEGTFVVREVGIEVPLDDPNDAAWPAAYREGVVEGAFLNPWGQVQVDDGQRAIRPVARMADTVPDPVSLIRDLRTKLSAASWSPTFGTTWRAAAAEMRACSGELTDSDARQHWLGIVADVERLGEVLGRQ